MGPSWAEIVGGGKGQAARNTPDRRGSTNNTTGANSGPAPTGQTAQIGARRPDQSSRPTNSPQSNAPLHQNGPNQPFGQTRPSLSSSSQAPTQSDGRVDLTVKQPPQIRSQLLGQVPSSANSQDSNMPLHQNSPIQSSNQPRPTSSSRPPPARPQGQTGQAIGQTPQAGSQRRGHLPGSANNPRSNISFHPNDPNQGFGQPRATPSDSKLSESSRKSFVASPAGNQRQKETQKTTASGQKVVNVYAGQVGPIPRPSSDVSVVEDAFIQGGSIPDQPGLKLSVRPDYGSQGKPHLLWTNCFGLGVSDRNLTLYCYTMTVDPDSKGQFPKGKKKTQLIKLMLGDESFKVLKSKQDTFIATDLNTTLITQEPLRRDPGEEGSSTRLVIRFSAEGVVHPPKFPVDYTIRISPPDVLMLSDLTDYLDPAKTTSDYNKSPVLRAFGVILGHHVKQSPDLVTVGSRKVFPYKPGDRQMRQKNLDPGLIALRGFYSSARVATSRILVNVNLAHSPFYQEIPLDRMIKTLYPQDINYHDLHRFLKKLRVRTIHLSREHKAYGKIRTISGLAMQGDGEKQEKPPKITKLIGGDPSEVSFFEDPTAFASEERESSTARSTISSKSKQTKAIPSDGKGAYITVKGFFVKTYPKSTEAQNLRRDLPAVNVGTRGNPIYLPADVCRVEPGQLSRSKLSATQTDGMIKFAKQRPEEYAESIVNDGRVAMGYNTSSTALDEFGISVGKDLITVPSRVLDKPSLQYTLKSRQFSSQAMVTEVSPTADGSWNFRSKRFHEPANVGTWYILRIAKGNPRNNLPPKTTLVKNLQRFEEIVKNTGITKGTTKTKDIVLNNINTDCSEVETYLEHIYKEKLASKDAVEEHPPDNGKSPQREEKHPPLLLVILPGSANRLYQRIKDYADRHGGFHTICVTGTGADEGVPEPYKCSSGSDKKFYAERADAYFANVALKINLKFNGINHILQNPEVLGPINEGSTMVVGIDVTHPSPGSNDEAPSIFALVASIDKNLAQWPAALGVQKKSRQEVISDKDKLMALFRSRLDLWAQRNGGRLPDKIIVYRDGVSEGQYEQVIDEELAALKEACREPYHSSNDSSNMPRFTFIIVAKRHHTRFFPTAIEDADQNSNAKCGTVVDRGITQARDWDFYLQSHSVVQEGTARPAHYVVLHDEIFRDYRNKSDMLQQVTYNMCYLYGPSTRAISICPPVYLADKACTRARLYLQDQFEPAPLEAKDSRDGDEEETDQEKAARLQREAEVLQSQQERLMVHEDLRDTMYYI